MMNTTIVPDQSAVILSAAADQQLCEAMAMVSHARRHVMSIDAILDHLLDVPAYRDLRDSMEGTTLASLAEFAEHRCNDASRILEHLALGSVRAPELPASADSGHGQHQDEWTSAVAQYEAAKAACAKYGAEIEAPLRAIIDAYDDHRPGTPLNGPVGYKAPPAEQQKWKLVREESDRLVSLHYKAELAVLETPAPDLAAIGYKCSLPLFKDDDHDWRASIGREAARLAKAAAGAAA